VIVAETADGFRFVTQPDHAALAGQFADHWGNDAFEPPEPAAAVALAAYAHDDGWWPYDRRPHLDSDGRPVDFREMPAATWVDLYDEGIDSVVDLDAYAGLVVSMHGTGLRRQRYGLSPSWPTPPGFDAFVDRQERRQARLVRALHAGEVSSPVAVDHGAHSTSEADVALLSALHETGVAPDGTASRLWRNYELLQAWDTLSLSFCTSTSPPSYGEIASVPTGADGSEVTLSVEPSDEGAFRVTPYPFDVDPLVVSVPTRHASADAFDDEGGLVRAYFDGGRETLTFALRSGAP